jgi:hypothetical protein
MITTQHTTSPWIYRRKHPTAANAGISILGPVDSSGCREVVAELDYQDGAEANARLIAVAPRLLDYARRLLAEIDFEVEQRKHSGNDEDWADLEKLSNEAQAVIAETEGRAA